MSIIEALCRNADVNPPASGEDIARAEQKLGVTLPDDYKQVVLTHDGYSSAINGRSVILWDVSQLFEWNEAYQITRYTPQLVGIGSDGGPYCLVLDYRYSPPHLAQMPFGAFEYDLVEYIARSLTDYIAMLLTYETPPRPEWEQRLIKAGKRIR